ncbi:MAG: hypothetical protein HP494_09375 [Nitrospira sp.]|nr:hypothetical protein [Nitrospira sp.]
MANYSKILVGLSSLMFFGLGLCAFMESDVNAREKQSNGASRTALC